MVDFDYFLTTSTDEGAAVPRPADNASRHAVFRTWLEAQRNRHAGTPTPGERLRRGEAGLGTVAWLLGLVAGAGLAGTWLAHRGAEPVNAPLFWMATVGVQVLLLGLVAAGWVWRRALARFSHGAAGSGLLQALLTRTAALGRRLPGERRQALQATLGQLVQRHATTGPLLTLPAVALAQRFGVAFNLGLLATMLALHLPLVDLRFGWQSTYPITPAQMHHAVLAVASPWHWALPQAQPSVEQIALTRHTQGQLPAGMPPEAAHAWWPFLVLSILCYGLLPRGLLLLGATLLQQRRLAQLRLDHPEANALWRRLMGPLVHTAELAAPAHSHALNAAPRPTQGACVVWVADELKLDDNELRTTVPQRFGWPVQAVHHQTIDDRLAGTALWSTWPRPLAALLIVVPAHRDPIVAIALFIRAALQAAGPEAQVLLLVTPADPERLALWQRFAHVQRLRVRVEAL